MLAPNLIIPGSFQSVLFIDNNHNSSALYSQTFPVLSHLCSAVLFSCSLSSLPVSLFIIFLFISSYNSHFGWFSTSILAIKVEVNSSSSAYFVSSKIILPTSFLCESVSLDVYSLCAKSFSFDFFIFSPVTFIYHNLLIHKIFVS